MHEVWRGGCEAKEEGIRLVNYDIWIWRRQAQEGKKTPEEMSREMGDG